MFMMMMMMMMGARMIINFEDGGKQTLGVRNCCENRLSKTNSLLQQESHGCSLFGIVRSEFFWHKVSS